MSLRERLEQGGVGLMDKKDDEEGAAGGDDAGQVTEPEPTGSGEEGAGEETTALSAVEEALGVSDDTETPAVDAPAGEKPAGDTPASAEGVQAEAQAEPDAGGAVVDEQGKPVAGEPVPEDPFEAPIPDEVKGKTRERMEGMIAGYNELKTNNAQLQSNHQGVLQMMTDTGASNEELATSMDYMRLRHSTNREDLQTALNLAHQEVQGLSKLLGVETGAVDLLFDHADLKQRVEDAELTRADALQIANARHANDRQNQAANVQAQAELQNNDYTTVANQAIDQLTQLDARFRQDINYDQYRRMIDGDNPNDSPFIQRLVTTVHPSQWAQTYLNAWQMVARTARATADNKPTPNPAAQPLAGGGSAGAGTREPTNMLEAVEGALNVAG